MMEGLTLIFNSSIVAVPHISAPPKWDLLDSSETPWLEQLCLDLQPEGFDCRLLLYNHITEVERERLDQGLPHIELAPDKEKEKECKYGITYWATRFVEALLKEREASQVSCTNASRTILIRP